jgi:undecaprenyl diphosphate synthase
MVKNKPKLRHVAIIMDGNGRWAKQHNKERLQGHQAGAEAVERVIIAANEIGLQYLTLYAFSTENWKRSASEVNGLMKLLSEFLDNKLGVLHENDIRLKTIGRTNELPVYVRKKLLKAIKETALHQAATLVLALNYGGRAEIADAASQIARDAVAGKINPEKVDEQTFGRYLYDSEIPDPELMIRTSGEFRLSNFLLWQLSYAEIYVSDVLWPDFDSQEFMKAVNDYYGRERRFGGRK